MTTLDELTYRHPIKTINSITEFWGYRLIDARNNYNYRRFLIVEFNKKKEKWVTVGVYSSKKDAIEDLIMMIEKRYPIPMEFGE